MSERLEKGLTALRGQMDSKVESFFSSCVNCGICAESCLFYTETKDPRYTPIYKTEPLRKLWKQEYSFWGKFSSKLGFTKTFKESDLADWEELVYDGCSMCGRCSMVCPMGIDIADIIARVKQGLSAAGYTPQDLVGAANRTLEFGSPMGNILPALKAHIKHIEADTGLTVPFDIEGADYMVTISANEVVTFPEYIGAITRIFAHANVSWTISSEAFEATNSGLQMGNNTIATELVGRIVAAAEKLKVKNVVSPECGHAYAAIRWNGPNYLGKKYTFGVVHILELLDELYRSGRIKTSGMETSRMTFHDPCQIVRRGGVAAQPRELLASVASDVTEMSDHGRMNWCCGGGGGVSANERAEELRIQVFNRKKSQLDEIKVETMVTACSNCRTVLEDGLDANDMDMEVLGLTELIADHLVENEALVGS
ncbi:(Fe-S)-binding protein [uncultured Cocleimonas sp.]|uniref:(Fe-S)-binding protein n=1 Tax=uncultured Cocleimonas sp. TaxID=1051587 RepID=UPI002627897E|nr:(Fe-S)-binding protein [uncultured Cocleimonas sp.]